MNYTVSVVLISHMLGLWALLSSLPFLPGHTQLPGGSKPTSVLLVPRQPTPGEDTRLHLATSSDASNPQRGVALRSPSTQHQRTIRSLLSKDNLFSFRVTSPREAMQCNHLDSQESFLMSHIVRPAPPSFLTQKRPPRSTAPWASFTLRSRCAGLQDPKAQNTGEKRRAGVLPIGRRILLTT